MSTTTYLLGALVAAGFGILVLVWRLSLFRRASRAMTDGTMVTWILLLSITAAQNVIVQQRKSVLDLFNQGLSDQNRFQVGVTVIAIAWGLILIVSGRVHLRELATGSMFWLTGLSVVFGVTSLWSTWPMLTLFRSLQLLFGTVLCVHLLSAGPWLRRICIYLVSVIAMFWISGIIASDSIAPEGLIGMFRANTGALAAAALCLVAGHCLLYRRAALAFAGLGLSIASLLVFSSLASTIGLLLAGLFILGERFGKGGRTAARTVMAALCLSLPASYAFSGLGDYVLAKLTYVGSIFGKDLDRLLSFSGRLRLWQVWWDLSKDQPFGLGFGAAERMFVLDTGAVTASQWAASHAHSGYLSGWIGAGWAGIFMIGAIFVSVLATVSEHMDPQKTLLTSLWVLILVNNFTTSGVGGDFSPVWVLMVGLAVCSVHQKETWSARQRILRAA